MAKNYHQIRKEYTSMQLDVPDVPVDPFHLLETWLAEAMNAGVPEPTAMNLATAGQDGKPSSRIVLLKEIGQGNLSFFSNYNSQKGKQLSENPWAALLFFWPQMERQIRLEGKVSKMSKAESEKYFKTRPPESQLAAWASDQSQLLDNRIMLEEKIKRLKKEFNNTEIKKPPFWGGYIFIPGLIEFWQGRPNRLHDRIVYRMNENAWTIFRMYP